MKYSFWEYIMHTMYYKFLMQLPDGGEYIGGAFFVDADLK